MGRFRLGSVHLARLVARLRAAAPYGRIAVPRLTRLLRAAAAGRAGEVLPAEWSGLGCWQLGTLVAAFDPCRVGSVRLDHRP